MCVYYVFLKVDFYLVGMDLLYNSFHGPRASSEPSKSSKCCVALNPPHEECNAGRVNKKIHNNICQFSN